MQQITLNITAIHIDFAGNLDTVEKINIRDISPTFDAYIINIKHLNGSRILVKSKIFETLECNCFDTTNRIDKIDIEGFICSAAFGTQTGQNHISSNCRTESIVEINIGIGHSQCSQSADIDIFTESHIVTVELHAGDIHITVSKGQFTVSITIDIFNRNINFIICFDKECIRSLCADCCDISGHITIEMQVRILHRNSADIFDSPRHIDGEVVHFSSRSGSSFSPNQQSSAESDILINVKRKLSDIRKLANSITAKQQIHC